MLPKVWNKKSYISFLNYLKKRENIDYRKFNKKLTFTKYEMIGIRIPDLRNIAKYIYKETDYLEFLSLVDDRYFEVVMIEGFVIAMIKEMSIFDKYFKMFIGKIDDWSICDSFCNSIKIVKNDSLKYFNLSLELAESREEFISRVGLIMILNHFVKKEYLDKIFKLLNSIKSDKYYVNMAEAWLVCELFIHYPQETKVFMKDNKLNVFTNNKAISKIRESYRVSLEDKEYVVSLKK